MKRPREKARQSRALRRLGVETLEPRQMLSAILPDLGLRDDMFVAVQGSQQNELPVLSNDGFARDCYQPAVWPPRPVVPCPDPRGLVIRSVSSPTAGSVQIDADGVTILYTPPSDFVRRLKPYRSRI